MSQARNYIIDLASELSIITRISHKNERYQIDYWIFHSFFIYKWNNFLILFHNFEEKLRFLRVLYRVQNFEFGIIDFSNSQKKTFWHRISSEIC